MVFIGDQYSPGNPLFGEVTSDEELLCRRPLCRAQIAGLVLGETKEAAVRGAKKIKLHIKDEPDEKLVFTIEVSSTAEVSSIWNALRIS